MHQAAVFGTDLSALGPHNTLGGGARHALPLFASRKTDKAAPFCPHRLHHHTGRLPAPSPGGSLAAVRRGRGAHSAGKTGGIQERARRRAGAAGGRAAHGKRCVRVARPLLTGAETCGPVDRAAPTPLACVQRKGQAQARCRAGPPHEQTKTSCSSPFPHTLARRAPSRRAAARDAMVRRAGWVSKPGAAWSACERERR